MVRLPQTATPVDLLIRETLHLSSFDDSYQSWTALFINCFQLIEIAGGRCPPARVNNPGWEISPLTVAFYLQLLQVEIPKRA